jgi:N-acetyl-anhydromuramyl-L-alanine amidase AmpD
VGVTWHWTATRDLALCTEVLGGAHAERKGEASAHYGIGRSFAEGVDRYVSIEDRSWHAGINQTLQWNGKALIDGRFKATRTTIGVETVGVGFWQKDAPAPDNWIVAAEPNGRHVMRVQPWTAEQIEMIVEIGRQIVERWPHIGFREHHGHHDICPGYKQDVAGFPFAAVLRKIYDNPEIPDVWSSFWTPRQRQEALVALGYPLGNGGVDGMWGRFSEMALRRFQRENGLVEDGMWTTFVSWKVYDVMSERAVSFGGW